MSPQSFYQAQQATQEKALSLIERRYQILSYLRLAVFFGGIVLVYIGFQLSPGLGLLMGTLALGLFFFLILRHNKVADQRDHTRRLLRILAREQAALQLDLRDFETGQGLAPAGHDYAQDLDLFGQRSIWQLLNRTGTENGQQRLSQWLLNQSLDPQEILTRQAAITELSQQIETNLDFEARAGAHPISQAEIDELISWTQEPAHYVHHGMYRLLVWVMPSLLGLALFGWTLTDFPELQAALGGLRLSGRIPLIIFLLQLGIVGLNVRNSNRLQAQVGRKSSLLRQYASLFQKIEQGNFQSNLLVQAQSRLLQPKASETIAGLGELVYRFDQRLNILMGIILNGTLLWDIRYMIKLERWRADHQAPLAQWFEALADWDALNSLGRFAFNHPDYTWPKPQTGDFALTGLGLGHPLLDPSRRVDNDLTFEQAGAFFIITGANMAGKSTFLRTVGVNLVLASMGAPVCAKQFEFVPVALMTSVRTDDSLADDASYFFAELTRLKAIIDRLKSEGTMFIILDEILRGTNSRDKQEGSRQFIEQLIAFQGVGMVATHDLALGKLAESYPAQVQNRRFEVEISADQLSFDYKLKEGISQNLNAVFLMKQMGIMP